VRVLVSGASGFVGQHLARALLASGAEVYGTSPEPAPAAPLLTPAERDAIRWLALDLHSEDSVRSVVAEARPEVVYHLAAQSSVAAGFADLLGTWDVNATGTLRLVGAMGEHAPPGARLLLASSAEVYGAVPEAEQPITETWLPAPINPYGASKAAAEMAARAGRGRMDVIVARSFPHTGPGQDARFALPSFARQLSEIAHGVREPVIRVGNLSARRDVCDVRDVVRAYLLLAEQGETGAVYNVCRGEAISMRELLERMIELSGHDVRVEVDPERLRPVDTPLLLGDPGRLQALGWAPEIPMRDTLRDLLASAGVA
jgi:GDP-4-dehydro-6-deoxy-D-mannose reductase